MCEAQQNSGYSVNGSFAEYATGAAAYVARLPERPDFTAMAPILCAGVTTYKGLKETEARPGEWVAIAGIGGLGHIAVQYAKAMGLHVVALDVTDDKLALARNAGADVTVNARSDAVAQVLQRDGCVAARICAGAAFRKAPWDRKPRWPSARRIRNANLRCCVEAHHHSRLYRGDT